MPALPRPSFRQLLLAAFAALSLLLGAVALYGQSTLERLLERSRAGSERTLALNGHAERLGEQGLAMERAARQYLVLRDAALRDAYGRAADAAAAHVRALADGAVAPALAERWHAQRGAIERLLPRADDRRLAQAFRDLDALRAEMAEQVRGATETGNAALQQELDTGRAAVRRMLAGSLVLAGALALGLALALARVETAIVALGENRFDGRIDIRGPADVRHIGRRLDWLRQRLAGLDADKARFLRHVSHELKTPLAALREGVALLQDGVAGPLSERQAEVARILHDNSATLQRRIEDLLRFNATAFAAERLVRKPADIALLVAGLVHEQQLQWQARGLKLRTEGGPLRADIDAALFASAVGNLLANAIRYSPRGATIGLVWTRDADGLVFDVIDGGPGVPPAERERIFEPFYRGPQPPADGGLPGTGIGLSIVAEAVAAHGGRVHLLATEAGAHFRIELPHALAD
jgi:two-component system sensor histidine kinase GlrK